MASKLLGRFPWFLLCTSAILFECATWFWMSGIEYTASPQSTTFTTQPSFILGQVLLFPLAGLYGAIFVVAAIQYGRVWAWPGMIAISSILAAFSVHSALPSSRIRPVIGDVAWRNTRLEELQEGEPHRNAWSELLGVLSGPPGLLEDISSYRKLRREEASFDTMLTILPPNVLNALPQPLDETHTSRFCEVYGSADSLFYRYPGNGKIYFKVLKWGEYTEGFSPRHSGGHPALAR